MAASVTVMLTSSQQCNNEPTPSGIASTHQVSHCSRSFTAIAGYHKEDQPARSYLAAEASFTGIYLIHPALEIWPFSEPTKPHQLPHTLPACLLVCILC
jgi:hypothetical protein